MPKSSAVQALLPSAFTILTAVMIAALLAGCGGSGMTTPPPPPGSTNVMVLMTGTANDKLVDFGVQIDSVTLTNTAGASVTLLNRPVGNATEFMHLNGASEPLAIASIPQGVYTSATVTVGACGFTAFFKDPTSGGPHTSTFQDTGCNGGTGKTTVNLSGPITIRGQAMALSFNLQVPQSYTVDLVTNNFTVTPVFTLTAIMVSAQPTSDQNGKISGIDAVITAVNSDGNSFMAQTISGFSLSLSTNGNTQFQGVGGLASLAPGMIASFDVAMQSNGTLQATRVEIDQATANGGFTQLPLYTAGAGGKVVVAEFQSCFPAPGVNFFCVGAFVLDPSATFQVSGQFNNLQNLPFNANFSPSTFFLGQSAFALSTGAEDAQGNPIASELTLAPQTINGTVTAVSSAGNFNVYTVSLAPYDLVPVTQQLFLGSFPAISNPQSVTVYADANTEMLQSSPIATGSLLRFRGLLFYDSGTVRMDCAKILDGVPE